MEGQGKKQDSMNFTVGYSLDVTLFPFPPSPLPPLPLPLPPRKVFLLFSSFLNGCLNLPPPSNNKKTFCFLDEVYLSGG